MNVVKMVFLTLFSLVVLVFAQEDVFLPYMQKATEPITVDGVLDEWNFCFPINMNQEVIPQKSRCRAWFPLDNDDLSGWIKLMWDEQYLYLAASVRDDVPGILPAPGWRADVVEVYIANYDVGDVPWAPQETGYPNGDDGRYAVQLAFFFDADGDSAYLHQWIPY